MKLEGVLTSAVVSAVISGGWSHYSSVRLASQQLVLQNRDAENDKKRDLLLNLGSALNELESEILKLGVFAAERDQPVEAQIKVVGLKLRSVAALYKDQRVRPTPVGESVHQLLSVIGPALAEAGKKGLPARQRAQNVADTYRAELKPKFEQVMKDILVERDRLLDPS